MPARPLQARRRVRNWPHGLPLSMDVDHLRVDGLSSLGPLQISSLQKGGFSLVSSLLLAAPRDLARVLKVSVAEVHAILQSVSDELGNRRVLWKGLDAFCHETFSSGDTEIDALLGGGIRTGMIWEVAGESSCGKSQLCMQLSLFVQLDPDSGGIAGATCYITVGAKLPTKRLVQMQNNHPVLSSRLGLCSLDDVHTQSAPTIDILMRILTVDFLGLQKALSTQKDRKPIRLLVIDSVASLFQNIHSQSSANLRERSKALNELSKVAHSIASTCNIAIVFVNNVSDVFSDNAPERAGKHEILYRDQYRWFSSAPSTQGFIKEVGLGLVWSNCMNGRIMLAKTNKRASLKDLILQGSKQTKTTHTLVAPHAMSGVLDEFVMIRSMSRIFGAFATPLTIPFVICDAGIAALGEPLPISKQISLQAELRKEQQFSKGPAPQDAVNAINSPSNAFESWDGVEVEESRVELANGLLDEEDI